VKTPSICWQHSKTAGTFRSLAVDSVYERKIRYEMVDGIAHIPGDALEEYRAKAS
jgi:hypothetical protein